MDVDAMTEYILAFRKETGKLPSITDLMLMQEAEASIAIDRDSDVRTMRTTMIGGLA